MNKVHKEKFNYRILITVAFLIITGIITMYSLRGNAYNYWGNEYFFINKMIIYTTLGIGAFLLISFFDYRKIKNKSAHLYILSIALFIVLFLFNSPVNNINSWINIGPISINVRDLAVNIFLISLVGIFKDIKWELYPCASHIIYAHTSPYNILSFFCLCIFLRKLFYEDAVVEKAKYPDTSDRQLKRKNPHKCIKILRKFRNPF